MDGWLKRLKRLNNAAATLSGTLIFLICLFAVIEVVLRTAFDHPTKWSLAYSQFMLLYAIFLGSAYCFQENGHIRVDIVLDHLPKRIRGILTILGLIMAAVFVAVLGWKAFGETLVSARFDYLTITTVQIPSAYLYVIIFIGSLLMLLSLLTLIIENVSEIKQARMKGGNE